jgi:hypothetical protein
VEQGLVHPNTPTIRLPRQSLAIRRTGLEVGQRQFIAHFIEQASANGGSVTRTDIKSAVHSVGGTISRTALQLALAELLNPNHPDGGRVCRVSFGRYGPI